MDAKIVLLTDVIDSRKVPEFAPSRDRALNRLAQSRPAIAYRHAITAWDEIQFLLERPTDLPEFFWRLITCFQPLQLRIGIGIGPASMIANTVMDGTAIGSRRAINEVGFGPAFESAREALNIAASRAKQSSQRTIDVQAHELNTRLNLSDSAISALCNAILAPLSVLIQDISPKQWTVLQKWNEVDQSQSETAEALEVNVSTVSRSLNRSNVWLILETLAHFETVLNELFAQKYTK